MSPEQESTLHLAKVFGSAVQRNVLIEVPLPRRLDRDRIRSALVQLSEIHPALRYALSPNDSSRQYISDRPLSLDPAHDGKIPEVDACRLALRLRSPGRDNGPRGYAEIHHAEDGRPTLLAAFDHLICDGASRDILIRHIIELTSGLDIPTPAVTLKKYCTDRISVYTQERTGEQECNSWSRLLQNVRPLTGLHESMLSAAPARQGSATWKSSAIYPAVRALVSETRSTPFAVVAGLLAIAIWRRTRIESSALVTPISNRRTAPLENLVANLVNERPIPYRVKPEMTPKRVIELIQQNTYSAMQNSQVSIPTLGERVPEFSDFFDGNGVNYLQLQVTSAERDDPGFRDVQDGFGIDVDAGIYQPSSSVTCTIMRVHIMPSAVRIGTFHGGSLGGHEVAKHLSEELKDLMEMSIEQANRPLSSYA
ncbi:condensation domain-containing protein [Streptomyces sp. NPDC050085]|uniref:condensation domain-containing protein n=1 Tax=Streptomyces sp. NPDC050085 TaxID=3365600 RepID=UPI0037A0627C